MINRIKQIWTEKGFEIILVLCIAFILIFGLYHFITGKKGTYSSDKNYYKYLPAKNYQYNSTKKHNSIVQNNRPRESKGEMECRRVLQNIFKKPFVSIRPDFLKNPVTGGNFNLELDCFNQDLRLAVEYNGVQHYKYVPYFHRNKDHFMTQKYRDDMKRRMCKENNIKLIEVPYTVKIQDIQNFLITECRKLGYQI